MKTVRKIYLLLLLLILVSGCIKLGPDYTRPETGITVPDKFHTVSDETDKIEITDCWWEDFGNPEINTFVDSIIKSNHDIRIATGRILEMRSYFKQTRADRFPSLGIQAEGRDQKIPLSSGMSEDDREFETYSFSLPASFELDLWGRLARTQEAARASLLAAEENRKTVMNTVIAEGISLYLQMEALERRIQVTKQSIENYRQSLKMIDSRYSRGLSSVLDVKQARRILARAEAFLPVLFQDLGIIQHRLSMLAGNYPETRPPRKMPEDYLKPLTPVKPGIPSDILFRRPDVRAAEAELESLNAMIGAAKASRFPRISLTGAFGYSSKEIDDLFEAKSELWNMAMGITQTVFDAGKLKAGQRAAEAKYKQGVSTYAKTVLNAFVEVESALLARKKQIERRELTLIFLKEARETLIVARKHYERGLVDYLTVLQAQQTLFTAEENLVLADLGILTNRVTLYRALGGGFAYSEELER